MSSSRVQTPNRLHQSVLSFPVRKRNQSKQKNLDKSLLDLHIQSPTLSTKSAENEDDLSSMVSSPFPVAATDPSTAVNDKKDMSTDRQTEVELSITNGSTNNQNYSYSASVSPSGMLLKFTRQGIKVNSKTKSNKSKSIPRIQNDQSINDKITSLSNNDDQLIVQLEDSPISLDKNNDNNDDVQSSKSNNRVEPTITRMVTRNSPLVKSNAIELTPKSSKRLSSLKKCNIHSNRSSSPMIRSVVKNSEQLFGLCSPVKRDTIGAQVNVTPVHTLNNCQSIDKQNTQTKVDNTIVSPVVSKLDLSVNQKVKTLEKIEKDTYQNVLTRSARKTRSNKLSDNNGNEKELSTNASVVSVNELTNQHATSIDTSIQQTLDTPVRKSKRINNRLIHEMVTCGQESILSNTPTRTTRVTRSQTPVRTPTKSTLKLGTVTKTPVKTLIKSSTIKKVSTLVSENEIKETPKTPTTRQRAQINGIKSAKSTPTKRKDVSCEHELTENVHSSPPKISRYFRQDSQPKQLNLFQKYKQALSTGNGDKLVYREAETQQVEQFLRSHLEDQKSSSLYISGPPGTGKTATVKFIANRLQDEFDFRFITLNGMTFSTPLAFYQKLLNELGQKNVTRKQILGAIETQLCCRKKMLLLLLDEIDELDSKHQEMLYTVFEWPRLTHSKIIIIGIANTLDLTSKTLVRIHSLKLTPMHEIPFKPYDRAQISGILNERIRQLKTNGDILIDDAAIELCARKVSSYSGDARKALDIMRRSIELVEHELILKQQEEQEALRVLKSVEHQNNSCTNTLTSGNDVEFGQNAKVKVTHVIKILNQVFGSKVAAVQDDECNFPLQQQLLLCVCLLLMTREACKEVEVGKSFDTFVRICNQKQLSLDMGNTSDFVSMCYLLEAKGFISLRPAKQIRSIKLSLSIDEEEVRDMLMNKPLFNSILKCE